MKKCEENKCKIGSWSLTLMYRVIRDVKHVHGKITM